MEQQQARRTGQEYFTNLYSFTIPSPENKNKQLKTTYIRFETPQEITKKEVKSAMKQMKNEKAPGEKE